jgi:hypothetical protein
MESMGPRVATFPMKMMVAKSLSSDINRLYVEMSWALNEGLFAVNIPRTKEKTTPTAFEVFADSLAAAYRVSESGDRTVS